jgi:hypothetical protein
MEELGFDYMFLQPNYFFNGTVGIDDFLWQAIGFNNSNVVQKWNWTIESLHPNLTNFVSYNTYKQEAIFNGTQSQWHGINQTILSINWQRAKMKNYMRFIETLSISSTTITSPLLHSHLLKNIKFRTAVGKIGHIKIMEQKSLNQFRLLPLTEPGVDY